ncbi:MAG: type II secretion system minor pseudopilin GspJ [Porticoccaceae bacterium]|nr:type II secretion system minor pseudopilin GspJ [Porticoccaceae bacterium]
MYLIQSSRQKKHSKSQSGFTLIETLVSLSLLAIISLMSYQAIEVVITADERSRSKKMGEAEIQRAWNIIQRDLMHLRDRPFKDGLGGVEPPYITDNSKFGVRFSRGGGPMVTPNPSGIRRINYILNDEQKFIRQSWGITESIRYTDGVTVVLLESVDEVLFEHLGPNNIFTPDWPSAKLGKTSPLPKMIRVTITMENGAETSRLFLGVSPS